MIDKVFREGNKDGITGYFTKNVIEDHLEDELSASQNYLKKISKIVQIRKCIIVYFIL